VNPKDKGNSIAAWQRTGVFCAATKSRRQAHRVTVQEATTKFPREAGIARYGEPEEIAELMAFLASPGARWMTGSTLRVDGGEVKSVWGLEYLYLLSR
jgi:NAD(P)-dependent dehydrogenase (short-subunit alcohol dehydrogenase family)